MRITIDIEEEKLDSVLKWTGQRKKSPALAQVVDEYLDQKKRQAFLARVLAGKTDYQATNAEIESFSSLDRS